MGADIRRMPELPKAARAKTCPICGKPAAERFRPFCSSRCADVDLNRWFSGAYRVPVVEREDDTEEAPPPERGDG